MGTGNSESILCNLILFLLVEIHTHAFHGGSGLGVKSCPTLVTCQAHLSLGNPMDREAWQFTVHGVMKESDMAEGS